MYLGIDIGGTFTDLVLMDERGTVTTAKALTTPGQLQAGLFNAIELAAQSVGLTTDTLLPQIKSFGHGTTQATNALIERDGARTGLITTRGFGDTLRLQRLMGFSAGIPVERLGWYSRRRMPEPIVPRSLVREVPERIDQAGNVLLPLDEAAVEAAVKELAAQEVQTFAVSLLWSFRNPAHERRIGEIVRDLCPRAYVSLSHEVAPVLGEYERTATAAMNSYLALKVVSYLSNVEKMLRERGFRGAFNILNSSGGVVPALEAASKPVLLVASGPTGGVMGSLQLAQMMGEGNVITTDMGGTSFDVALIADGRPLVSSTHEAGGFHLSTPMVDITAVGAGGGSIAAVVDGQLQVGPASAGAKPGPVCYGTGGTLATVTDADVVLGIYAPENFLGGRMKLDYEGAVKAIREQIAEPLGITVQQAAAGIRRVVDSHMADTLREVTIGRGHDPRDFTLFAYGGAGPAHSAGFGVELGVKRIVVPATSMAHSAFGGLASDITQSAELSDPMSVAGRTPWTGLDPARIAAIFDDLEQRCIEAISRAGIPRDEVELARTVDMRYRRQAHDLMIPMDSGPITGAGIRALIERFDTTYEQVYGKGAGFRDAGITLSTFRVTAVGRTAKPALRGPTGSQVPQPAQREIFEPTLMRLVDAAIWPWLELPEGHQVHGPAVIEHPETTVYVGPQQTASLDALGNLIIEFNHGAHTNPTAGGSAGIDAITAEVIRNKLQAIVEEQAITLKTVSGSPVVAEASDFNCGLYLDDGSIVVMGPQVLFHSGTMSTVIKGIMEHCSENPGIHEGDMFILNDPYRGAIHQPDVSIVAPVFHDGKRIAWVGACAHQLDMGGMNFGSWAYQATEIQQEAMLLPGLKIVEGGEIRQDIWQMIMGMSRLPQVIGLDFKAMIAANNVARRRFDELMDRYGMATVVQVMRDELDRSEQQMRARLRSLPDGIYRARDYLDHDGHQNRLYPVCVTVEKRGGELIVDMAGTAPQAPGFINCTWSGMRGAVFSGLLPILTPDIRWNEGLMRAVTLKADKGTLCNAQFPAPVSGGTISGAWVVSNVTVAAMSRLAGCSPQWCVEGQAVTKGQFSVMTLAGRDRDGGPFGTFFMDSMAGGGGAFTDHDGLDGSGDYVIPRPVIANVEANESSGPILYLHRTFIADTGGAGRNRGGNTVGMAITPHDADALHATVVGHGVEVPNSVGLFGGLPGGCASHLKAQPAQKDIGSLLQSLWAPGDFAAQASQLGAKPGSMPLHAGEVLGYSFQGGGGYGDPLARDPEKVAEDVRQQMVSADQARRLYGVALQADGAADLEATAQLRAQRRRERIGAEPRKPAPAWREGELPELRLFAGRSISCHCGKHLAGPGQNWKDAAVAREVSAEEAGVHIRLHADLALRQYFCPDCATSLELEVMRRGEKPLPTFELLA